MEKNYHSEDFLMNTKEYFLSQLEVKIPHNLMQYNINLFKRNEDEPFAAIFTNSRGNTVARFNPWDTVDGVNLTV